MANGIEARDLKIIIIGDSAVGKSKMVERFLESKYTSNRLSTHGCTIFEKSHRLSDGTTTQITIWDTAGQEKFNNLHPSCYFQADACIMVFDVTRKQTYVGLKHWYNELREQGGEIPVIVAANKCDVNYMVTKKRFKFPSEKNLPFFFVSSADGTNIVRVFEEAICAAIGQRKFGPCDFLDECLVFLEDSIFNSDEAEDLSSS
jgi:Rab-like protein 2